MIDFKVHLENEIVSLPQTVENHFEGLYKVGNNLIIWEQHLDKDRWKFNNFRKYIDGGLKNREGCFTIIDKGKNKIIGTTRYYSFNKDKLSVKIGYTFISQHYWGTHINYQIKKLMLDYIFQYLDKVYFDIWKTNYRSQKSVEKIGGKKLSLEENNKYLYLIEKKVWENLISTQS
tara:strand:- start:28 stop:552 length:525 start_codon:yes stop_codon:yes gene_type:complete